MWMLWVNRLNQQVCYMRIWFCLSECVGARKWFERKREDFGLWLYKLIICWVKIETWMDGLQSCVKWRRNTSDKKLMKVFCGGLSIWRIVDWQKGIWGGSYSKKNVDWFMEWQQMWKMVEVWKGYACGFSQEISYYIWWMSTTTICEGFSIPDLTLFFIYKF